MVYMCSGDTLAYPGILIAQVYGIRLSTTLTVYVMLEVFLFLAFASGYKHAFATDRIAAPLLISWRLPEIRKFRSLIPISDSRVALAGLFRSCVFVRLRSSTRLLATTQCHPYLHGV